MDTGEPAIKVQGKGISDRGTASAKLPHGERAGASVEGAERRLWQRPEWQV